MTSNLRNLHFLETKQPKKDVKYANGADAEFIICEIGTIAVVFKNHYQKLLFSEKLCTHVPDVDIILNTLAFILSKQCPVPVF